jgi:D-galacturonate reductase
MSDNKVNVLMVGTGEYTTGYVGGGAADSDKGAGVVALTMFDLRRRSKVERVGMCGVNVRFLLLLFGELSINLTLGSKTTIRSFRARNSQESVRT